MTRHVCTPTDMARPPACTICGHTTPRIYVTHAQRDAARLIIRRATAAGRPVRDAIRKIANARPAHRCG